ncbi:hypothetical protein [Thermanaeromonas sp. C210]|uniref:hypothetical protein n=1 Tax=Thermanaeromonas sp. C210 TaxID=2731925 RepID=UPI00155B587B|nr:hypothetical protein [Thermanaeromonas sp. C210]GFN23376.1 hypothetical protein TAMC210_16930 [Thermanaeromonas sp. C210]
MRYLVTLTLDSATLVGDRREPSAYFLPSRDFIPGGVLRAALARAIREDCPYETGSVLSNWVEFTDGPLCAGCSWRGLCSCFGDLRFSHLYKEGAKVAPLTSYRCKFDERHPVFDTLFKTGMPRCPECGSPAERAAGYLDSQNGLVGVNRRLLTRLEVDPFRQVAQEKQLYALRVLSAGQTFRGSLAVPGPAVGVPSEFTLRLGAKTSVGLGRVQVRIEEAVVSNTGALQERIRRFQEKARGLPGLPEDKEAGESFYLSLTLLADTLPARKLRAAGERVPTETLQRELLQSLLPDGTPLAGRIGAVIRVVADFEVYGGYCTAERLYGRRNASLYVSAGSVFLCRIKGFLEGELLQSLKLLEEQGLGQRTEDGYGAVSICDEFHLSTGGVTGEGK